MEPWRKCWRESVAPSLNLVELEALRLGLVKDDSRIVQGQIVRTDVPGSRNGYWNENAPAVAGCAVGFAKMASFSVAADILNWTHKNMTGKWDKFLLWFDAHPRNVVFPQLLAEVNRSLALMEDQSKDTNHEPSRTDTTGSPSQAAECICG